MPILNGYEACKQIKQHFDQEKHLFIGEKKLKIPLLVAFSGFVDPETEIKCKEVGFDIIIQAPLT